jgi:NAD(P)-dependent dehydrogenase (short-subunit alcohol dehydrogenase family)
MEGKFYRFKSPFHPHTNMAKAALNMMTRTAAADYADDNIFMTAVDTVRTHKEKARGSRDGELTVAGAGLGDGREPV